MKQISLANSGFELVTKRTRKREFLDEMNLVVPWTELIGLIEPHAPAGKTGRPPFGISIMLRIHFLQQWFGLSDPAMEEALHDVPLYREFAGLDAGATVFCMVKSAKSSLTRATKVSKSAPMRRVCRGTWPCAQVDALRKEQ